MSVIPIINSGYNYYSQNKKITKNAVSFKSANPKSSDKKPNSQDKKRLSLLTLMFLGGFGLIFGEKIPKWFKNIKPHTKIITRERAFISNQRNLQKLNKKMSFTEFILN